MRRDPELDRDFVGLNTREAAFEKAQEGLGSSALISVSIKSGTDVPRSETLARSTGEVGIPTGLGVRRESAAFEEAQERLGASAFISVSIKS